MRHTQTLQAVILALARVRMGRLEGLVARLRRHHQRLRSDAPSFVSGNAVGRRGGTGVWGGLRAHGHLQGNDAHSSADHPHARLPSHFPGIVASWIEDWAPVGLRFLRGVVPSFGAEEIAVIDHPWGLACGVAQFSIDLAASGAARGLSIGAPAFVAEASLALLRWQGVGGALRIVVRQARLRLRVRLFDGGLAHARRGQRQLNSSKGRPRPLGVIERALLSSLGASPGTDFRPRGHSNRRAPAAAAAAVAGLPSHFDLTSIARIPTNPSTSTTHRQRGIDPSIHSSKQQQQPWRWWGLTWAT